MKAIFPSFDDRSKRAKYLQLYDYIKSAVTKGEMSAHEKLPSLRSLSAQLSLSITTVELAYSQLQVEGYIYSLPKSGFFVSDINATSIANKQSITAERPLSENLDPLSEERRESLLTDPACFDFTKWKKCIGRVLSEYSSLLLLEADPRGELSLREEISKYLHLYRGVDCSPENIVIGAGTQQIVGQLCLLLSAKDVRCIALETPGYLPAQRIFEDRSFLLYPTPVREDGIEIERLPMNIRCAVYVNPSNQFPTGALMPIGRRNQLLDWARANDNFIIEDDYDGELRYFGRPIPALQGLDSSREHVIYISSFSSTLFPSLRLSFMALPPVLSEAFDELRQNYNQTCSKTEQLALALYLNGGYYGRHIKKLRSLYSQKLDAFSRSIGKYGGKNFSLKNTESGISFLLKADSEESSDRLSERALSLGISTAKVDEYTTAVYYNRIPLSCIDELSRRLFSESEA